MVRKILNRKELREEADAAERVEGQEGGEKGAAKVKEKKAPPNARAALRSPRKSG